MENLHLHINLSFQQLLDVVQQLSPDEKIKLNEFLWSENSPIPEEHQKLVLDRIAKAKNNPKRLEDWDLAVKKLRS
ncbi:MAG: addiction module protein [Cytophagales bacterium]|nr:addiction module protein [Cytophagales bacterium]